MIIEREIQRIIDSNQQVIESLEQLKMEQKNLVEEIMILRKEVNKKTLKAPKK
jgi:hypothetical protein